MAPEIFLVGVSMSSCDVYVAAAEWQEGEWVKDQKRNIKNNRDESWTEPGFW